jgi:hypothetical protein
MRIGIGKKVGPFHVGVSFGGGVGIPESKNFWGFVCIKKGAKRSFHTPIQRPLF